MLWPIFLLNRLPVVFRLQQEWTGEEISWLCELQPAPANSHPRPSSLLQNWDRGSPPAPLPHTPRLCSVSSLWGPAVAQAGLSGCGGSPGEGDTLQPAVPVGWSCLARARCASPVLTGEPGGPLGPSFPVSPGGPRAPGGPGGPGGPMAPSRPWSPWKKFTQTWWDEAVLARGALRVSTTCTASLGPQHPGLCCPRAI